MFDQIFDAIELWMRDLLTGMINSNLQEMFTDVNQKTGEIARPKLERIESDILNNFKVLGVPAYPLTGEERLQILYETFNPEVMSDFKFDYNSMVQSGLTTKDYVAPTSFVFKDGKTFMMGNTLGAVSYLQILAPELTDKMLAEFLDMDKDLIVNLHVQSVDQIPSVSTSDKPPRMWGRQKAVSNG